ncbi:MAG: MBL fold metallo-hydrolase, partial [Halobacteria archaeon]|nr:MBL fold metallo-hydrolase [Halobacteria archaeon]
MVEALRVHDSVWRLSLGGVNAYVVDSPDDGVTVVDAGWTWNAGDVRDGISDTGHSVEDVERVLVTHYDIDHVGGLSELGLRRSTTVHVGREDAGFLTGEEKPRVTNHKGALQRVVSLGIRRPDLNVEKVDDCDSVGGEFTAYHTPGHTPGHTVYVSESLGVAFLGDLVSEDGGEFKL